MSHIRARIGFSFSKGLPGLGSRLIMFITRAPCSHAFFVVWDEALGCEMVLEANDGGFAPVALVEWLRSNNLVAVYLPKVPIDEAIPAYDAANLGRSYDWRGLLGMAWVELGRRLGRTWANPWADRTALFCSEAVAAVLAGAGYPGLDGHLASSTDPGQLLELLSHDGSTPVSMDPPADPAGATLH